MRCSKAAIMLQDRRLADKIIKEARSRGVTLMQVLDTHVIPLNTKVLITSRSDLKEPTHLTPVFVEDFTSVRAIIDKVIEVNAGKKKIREVTISIDPGKRMGVAFIADGVIIRTANYTDYNNLISDILEFANIHPTAQLNIVIGSGAGEYRDKLIEKINQQFTDKSINIYLIPEHGSSHHGIKIKIDETAALTFHKRFRKKLRR
ncbi:MAG TPA: hypothetical protein EYH45_00180 [Candidatus Caldiarchaeum subterraneum]|uniref:Uncharacterized protein n=1 Tax=Caldiarchaeum subterraneum TaxID=311458 RepID=A0A832ZUA2_CALS0|nr:hypothetical protein [Candidatus Caldarchaeum subterraneum]